jgi:hypothetical protein
LNLFDRLEKTANEAYQEEKRDFTTGEELVGSGIIAGGAGAGYGVGRSIANNGMKTVESGREMMPELGKILDPEDMVALRNGYDGAASKLAKLPPRYAGAGALLGAGAAAAYGTTIDRTGEGFNQAASYLMSSLEKTANEAYPEEGRINRGFLAESALGSGPIGYFAKKHNGLGVNEDDSHTMANAKLMGGSGALAGAGYGAAAGGYMGGKAGAVAGAIGGAVGLGAYGAGVGAVNGLIHDGYDTHLRNKEQRAGAGSVSHNPAGFDQAASALMMSLEKTANEAHQEEGRINRGFLAESALGSGPVGYFAKKHNGLGVNEDDSHAMANAKLVGGAGALGGAGYGAVAGGFMGGKAGAAVGAIGGAIGGGAYGAGVGAVNGLLHDGYDNHLRNKEQLASEELINSLEKTAAGAFGAFGAIKGVVSGVKNTISKAVGTDYRKAKKTLDVNNTPAALKTNVEKGISVSQHRQGLEVLDASAKAAKDGMKAAQKKVGIGAAGVAVGGAGVAGTNAMVSNRQEEKLASEDFMTELYKEAATQILDKHAPEVKSYVNPMDLITFNR